MKFGREHIALNAKDSTPTAEANTLQKNILCHHCSIQWSILQETIFFKTRIDLVKWSYIIYAISFYPRKVSVKWLMTELKINSYNTVWHMANKVKTVANHSPKDKCIFRELEKIFRRHRFI